MDLTWSGVSHQNTSTQIPDNSCDFLRESYGDDDFDSFTSVSLIDFGLATPPPPASTPVYQPSTTDFCSPSASEQLPPYQWHNTYNWPTNAPIQESMPTISTDDIDNLADEFIQPGEAIFRGVTTFNELAKLYGNIPLQFFTSHENNVLILKYNQFN